MTPTQQRIYDLVSRRPRSYQDLIDAIWWIHPQDAPDRSTLKAHIWHLNQKIKSRGQCIRGTWGGAPGRDSIYRLCRIP